MREYGKNRGRSSFDEASYYQGNNFFIGFENTSSPNNNLNTKWDRPLHRPDERIQEDVWKVLRSQTSADVSDVEVIVKNGVIRLSGSVNQLREKCEVESSVEKVPGTMDVLNEIRVRKFFG